MAPEARGDKKFLTLSISRGSGNGGRKEGTDSKGTVSASRGLGYLCDNGPRVRVSMH